MIKGVYETRERGGSRDMRETPFQVDRLVCMTKELWPFMHSCGVFAFAGCSGSLDVITVFILNRRVISSYLGGGIKLMGKKRGGVGPPLPPPPPGPPRETFSSAQLSRQQKI